MCYNTVLKYFLGYKMNSKRTIEQAQVINIQVADMKKISAWPGVQTIKDHNLQNAAGKKIAIVDALIRRINDKYPNKISDQMYLDSLRLVLYGGVAKTEFNVLSYRTRQQFPEYAKAYKNALSNHMESVNLSKDNSVIFISKIASILNSYKEAILENTLGNRSPEILEALSYNFTMDRVEEESIDCKDKELVELITNDCLSLINSPESSKYSKIINITANQTEINRWSRKLSLNNFTLLEHSTCVVGLVDNYLQVFDEENSLNTKEKLDIFRYSFYHDYPEAILNDIPSPVKKRNPELIKELEKAEDIIFEPLNLNQSKLAKFICKIADINHCLYEAKMEIEAGNRNPEFREVVNSYADNYQVQLNKFKDYVDPKIVNNIAKMYLEPELIKAEKKKLVEYKNDFVSGVIQAVCEISKNENLDSVKDVNEIINSLNGSVLGEFKIKLREALILGELNVQQLNQNCVNIDQVLLKSEIVIENEHKETDETIYTFKSFNKTSNKKDIGLDI